MPSARPSDALAERVRRLTSARSVELAERVQELWSGYGGIYRATLSFSDAPSRSVVVKGVNPPRDPKGDPAALRSHRRKLRSYQVEAAFYTKYAAQCGPACRVPVAERIDLSEGRALFVLEDLDASGFPARRRHIDAPDVEACLRWLAEFHATFLGTEPEGLWKVGTYWHLATRPDELAALRDPALRKAAPAIDARLNRARYRTLVHGDAKLENFCFAHSSVTSSSVAAVDFQYVGAGVGVKDVAYFLSSCLPDRECSALADGYVDFYFRSLSLALATRLDALALAELEAEWRALYAYAWADFQRFLAGWAPAYANHAYAIVQTRRVLAELSTSRENSSSES